MLSPVNPKVSLVATAASAFASVYLGAFNG